MNSKKSQPSPIIVTTKQTDSKEQYPQAEIRELAKNIDPFKIISAEIKGDFMEFEVSYTGGCEIHEFKLAGSPVLSKSLPPIRNIQLEHNKKGDQCKAIKTEKLKFAISILSDNYLQNEVKLFLVNNQKSYSYHFQN